MKNVILTLALTLTTVSAQAKLDFTTCNPDLVKVLSATTYPDQQQMKAALQVIEVQSQKFEAVKSVALKIQTKMNETQSESAGKLKMQVEVFGLLTEELNSYRSCIDRAYEILGKK